jgi:hypothetical protein
MKKLLVFLCTLGLVFCVAANVQATSITFNLAGPVSPGPFTSLVFTDISGVELTVTAQTQANNPLLVSRNVNGLGVKNSGDAADGAKLDSNGVDEKLRFTITGLPTGIDALVLTQVAFRDLGIANTDPEDFQIKFDGAGTLGSSFTPSANPWNVADNLALADRTFETDFFIRATDAGGVEGFRIFSVTVEAYSPVPEPATLLLLGTGLIGLAGLSRRKFFKK